MIKTPRTTLKDKIYEGGDSLFHFILYKILFSISTTLPKIVLLIYNFLGALLDEGLIQSFMVLKLELNNRVNFKTKFEDFLPLDKKKTLEMFIFDDEVYNIVKDIIFKLHNNKTEKEFNNSNILNSLHFSGTESKLKRLTDIPRIKCSKKIVSIFPMMNNKKLSFINTNSHNNEEFHKNRALTINK